MWPAACSLVWVPMANGATEYLLDTMFLRSLQKMRRMLEQISIQAVLFEQHDLTQNGS